MNLRGFVIGTVYGDQLVSAWRLNVCLEKNSEVK